MPWHSKMVAAMAGLAMLMMLMFATSSHAAARREVARGHHGGAPLEAQTLRPGPVMLRGDLG